MYTRSYKVEYIIVFWIETSAWVRACRQFKHNYIV